MFINNTIRTHHILYTVTWNQDSRRFADKQREKPQRRRYRNATGPPRFRPRWQGVTSLRRFFFSLSFDAVFAIRVRTRPSWEFERVIFSAYAHANVCRSRPFVETPSPADRRRVRVTKNREHFRLQEHKEGGKSDNDNVSDARSRRERARTRGHGRRRGESAATRPGPAVRSPRHCGRARGLGDSTHARRRDERPSRPLGFSSAGGFFDPSESSEIPRRRRSETRGLERENVPSRRIKNTVEILYLSRRPNDARIVRVHSSDDNILSYDGRVFHYTFWSCVVASSIRRFGGARGFILFDVRDRERLLRS